MFILVHPHWLRSRERTTHALGHVPRAEIYARRGHQSTPLAASAAVFGDSLRFEGSAPAASPMRWRGGCSSCVVLPRLLEVHSVAHVAEVGPPEDCSVAGGGRTRHRRGPVREGKVD